MTTTRLRESIPTPLYEKLSAEADKRGVRTSHLLIQILTERYQTVGVKQAPITSSTPIKSLLDDLVFEE